MRNIKLCDVRLRGCGYTLLPACEEVNIPFGIAKKLLGAIYSKAGMFNEVGCYLWDWKSDDEKSQVMPMKLTEVDMRGINVSDMIEYGLIEKVGRTFLITEKFKDVLKRSADIQKELDCEDFTAVPCMMF